MPFPKFLSVGVVFLALGCAHKEPRTLLSDRVVYVQSGPGQSEQVDISLVFDYLGPYGMHFGIANGAMAFTRDRRVINLPPDGQQPVAAKAPTNPDGTLDCGKIAEDASKRITNPILQGPARICVEQLCEVLNCSLCDSGLLKCEQGCLDGPNHGIMAEAACVAFGRVNRK